MRKPIGIGVNVLVRKNGKVLFGQRKGGTGDGEWCLPGGKVDHLEYLRVAAYREVIEETGISLTGLSEFPVNVTNDPRREKNEHYIHFTYEAETEQEPRLLEPENFSRWGWFDLSSPPEPIFYGHRKLVAAIRQGQGFAD